MDDIRVLLVDDEVQQNYLVSGYLQKSKVCAFHVDWVSTLDDCIKHLQHNHYDVCLLDYELGDNVTGIDVLKAINALEIDIPIIFLTGYGSSDIDIEAMSYGAADFIDKTIMSTHVLDRAIRYTVQQYRHTEALRQSELRFRAMVEKGSDLIIQLNGNGDVTYTSPSISRILGYAEDKLIHQPFSDYIHPDDLPILADMFNQLTTMPKNPIVATYRIRSREETWQWVESVATNLLFLRTLGVIIINARDITERRQLLLAEQGQRVVAEALLDTSIALTSTLNFNDVLSRILDSLEQVIPHRSSNVMLIDDNNWTYAAIYRGYDFYSDTPSLEAFRFDIEHTPILARVVEHQLPFIVPDVQKDPTWRISETASGVRSHLAVPIIEGQEVIGFINLDSEMPNYFTEKHIEYLRVFANLATVAIRNARSYRQAQELAAIEERQRLARELHDAVSQTLFSSSVIADSLTRLPDDDKEKLQLGLEKLTQLNRGALAEMRSLLVELRPQAIVNMPLTQLLRNLTNGLRGRANVDIDLEIIGEPLTLEPDVHLQLYRVTQEILANIHKHAHAQQIHMTLRFLDQALEIAIADDGIGFNPDNIAPGHHGIQIMHERIAKIAGSITIESAPEEGTYIHIHWSEKVEESISND